MFTGIEGQELRDWKARHVIPSLQIHYMDRTLPPAIYSTYPLPLSLGFDLYKAFREESARRAYKPYQYEGLLNPEQIRAFKEICNITPP